jgi:Ni,Fe-hydrogenase III large subunit
MQPINQTDHIAILSLMMVGVLTKRMKELGQLDTETARHLHRLVKIVGEHARSSGVADLQILFDNIDNALA